MTPLNLVTLRKPFHIGEKLIEFESITHPNSFVGCPNFKYQQINNIFDYHRKHVTNKNLFSYLKVNYYLKY